MKKLMMTFAAVLCCALISTTFTACSSDDGDSLSDFAAYTVNPSGEFSGNCLAICEEMRAALKTGMPIDKNVCKRDDAKAIRICDEVYKNTIATAKFKIVLDVTPLGDGIYNQSTTIKTYEY